MRREGDFDVGRRPMQSQKLLASHDGSERQGTKYIGVLAFDISIVR